MEVISCSVQTVTDEKLMKYVMSAYAILVQNLQDWLPTLTSSKYNTQEKLVMIDFDTKQVQPFNFNSSREKEDHLGVFSSSKWYAHTHVQSRKDTMHAQCRRTTKQTCGDVDSVLHSLPSAEDVVQCVRQSMNHSFKYKNFDNNHYNPVLEIVISTDGVIFMWPSAEYVLTTYKKFMHRKKKFEHKVRPEFYVELEEDVTHLLDHLPTISAGGKTRTERIIEALRAMEYVSSSRDGSKLCQFNFMFFEFDQLAYDYEQVMAQLGAAKKQ